MNIAYWVMYYNKNIFEEQGIDEPTTWEELDEAAATLKDAGVTPYYQTSNLFTFQWFQQLVAGTDPELYKGLSTGDVKYTDPEIVDIMNIWLDEHEKGWFSDAGSTIDPAVGLKQGDFAMINFGSFFNGSLDGAGMVSGEDYDMFVIPAVNADLGTTPVAVESGPLCVAENSKQKDLGLAYSEWWMSPDAQTAWNAARGDVAFNPKATVNDPMLSELGTTVADGNHRCSRATSRRRPRRSSPSRSSSSAPSTPTPATRCRSSRRSRPRRTSTGPSRSNPMAVLRRPRERAERGLIETPPRPPAQDAIPDGRPGLHRPGRAPGGRPPLPARCCGPRSSASPSTTASATPSGSASTTTSRCSRTRRSSARC